MDRQRPAPTGAPEARRAATTAAEVLLAGAELSGLLDRLLRREANVSLVQYRVLAHLRAVAPAAAEPWEIAAALRLSPAHTTTVLAQLDDAGLAARGPHPSDGRRRLARLTAGGAERLELVDPLVASFERRLLGAALSDDEARRLRELLGRVRAHMATLSVPGVRSQVGP